MCHDLGEFLMSVALLSKSWTPVYLFTNNKKKRAQVEWGFGQLVLMEGVAAMAGVLELGGL